MKRSLFGYNISEVDIILNTLRRENESLNNIINVLKAQIEELSVNGTHTKKVTRCNLNNNEENI